MLRKNRLKIIFIFLAMIIIIAFPKISKDGVTRGLILSTSVIIPSLFPFMICVLMLTKNNLTIDSSKSNKILYKFLGQNFNIFFLFILSMLGGYPVGAVMINKMRKNNEIGDKSANIILTYCVNAGPAFIVFIVGDALSSRKIGIVLLVANILSSIILSISCSKDLKKEKIKNITLAKKKNTLSQNFYEIVSETSLSLIRICSYVTLFSVINSYLEYFFTDIPILRSIQYFTEVTYAATNCKNIFLVSFLIAFSGLSIWCQIFALLTDVKINYKRFIVSRILHAVLSTSITYFIVNIFKIKINTFNNNINFNRQILYSDISLFISMLIMILVLLIFVFSKNNSGKLIDDVL